MLEAQLMSADSISKPATVALRGAEATWIKSHPSTVAQNPTQVLHKEIQSPAQTTDRKGKEGLIFHVTLQSVHVRPVKQ